MDDDEDEVSNPWADGQCSRTSAYPRPGRGQLEVRKMSSFNISSLVRDTGAPGASQRPGVPVGVVTARQRVTTTTHTEIVTSLAPASASLTSAPGLAPSPFLAPHLAPHQPHLAPSLPQLGSNVPQLHPTAQLSAVPPPPGGLVSPLAHHALSPPPPSPYMFGFPDPHYYYFLQQQLLLLQHHQYLQAQVQTLPSLPSRAANINYLQSLENSVNSLKNPDPVKKLHDGIIADKLIHNTDIFNSLSSHAIQEEKKNEDVLEVESSQTELLVPEKSVEDSNNPEYNETTDESFINVDDEEENAMEASGDNVIGENDTSLKCEEDTSGLNLLAASIENFGCSDVRAGARQLRVASAECAGLQILCDVADSQEKISASEAKSERSKSVDCDSRRGNNVARLEESISLQMQNNIAEMGKHGNDLNNKLDKIEKINKKKIKIKKIRQKDVAAYELERLHALSQDERETVASQDSLDLGESLAGGVNILTSFTETFQKFKKSYLSKNAADSKQTQNLPKKIPTLENWTTIMQEKKLKKEAEVQEKGLNNNLNVKVEETESKLITTVQRTIISSFKDECCTMKDIEKNTFLEDIKNINVDEDLRNNNDWIQHQNITKEKDFRNVKKKMKLKKKYKEQQKIQTEEKVQEVEINTKKKKKKKKEKKERREKEKKEKLKEKKEEKKDKAKRTVNKIPQEVAVTATTAVSFTLDQPPPSCNLTSDDLTDGLRVLLRLGGHFHPSRLTEISPPDIYGIVVDKERGNKPHILSREEVLQRAVSSENRV